MRTYRPLDWIFRGETRAQLYLERAEGFREVIEAILETFTKIPPLHDYSLGPVVFLLRHWIELQLKGIIVYVTEPADHESIKGHDIAQLYKLATKITKDFASNRNLDWPCPNSKVERLISLLGNYDSKGEVFRYPETLDGESVFQEPMDNDLYDMVMTVEGLTESCSLIFGDLDGLEGWMDNIKENEEEAEREEY